MTNKTVYVALQQFCESDPEPRELLQQANLRVEQNLLGHRLKREEIVPALKDADAVVAGVEPYDAEILTALPRLRCISRCGVGTDAIDLDAAQRLNIRVLNTAEEVIEPVAQMTLSMIFALARNLPAHQHDFSKNKWVRHTGRLLSEWTVGLLGLGRIGKAVAKHLNHFGVTVLAHDPHVTAHDAPSHVKMVDLATLLKSSDVISLHAARAQSLGYVLTSAEFKLMKSGAFLVNTARGYLVEEKALLEALSSKHLAGAALDVFEEEPYQGPLASLPNVLCTPHISTLTASSRAAMERRACLNLVEFFKNV